MDISQKSSSLVLASVAAEPLQLDSLYKEVLRYSLLQRGADASTITIHRLVQAVLQDNLPSETCSVWKRRATNAVNTVLPDPKFKNWTDYERLVPHSLVCADWIEQEQITSLEAAHLLSMTGSYLSARARYDKTEWLYRRALVIEEELLGPNHPAVATGIHNLANLYQKLERRSSSQAA